MSKPIIITLVLSMLVSGSPVTAFAEDKISPADLPETVYQQLLEHSDTDANKDGILTEEEYCNATYISLETSHRRCVCRLPLVRQRKGMGMRSHHL